MKKLAVPASAAANDPWIFEIGAFTKSPSESKGINKVSMFNSGEVPLMQDVGLSPVFFRPNAGRPADANLIYIGFRPK